MKRIFAEGLDLDANGGNPAVHASPTTGRADPAMRLRRLFKAARDPLLVVFGLGTFLAILSPYGTSGLGWPAVWFYWCGLMALGTVFGFGAGHLLSRLKPDWPEWSQYAFAAFAVAVPVTLAVMLVNTRFEGGTGWSHLPLTFFFVLVISAFATATAWVTDRLRARPSPPGRAAPGPALTGKLPINLRTAPVRALQSEDHYLRVHTARGDALILMRLSDAIAAMTGIEGAQTHRSWWVARDAVRDVKKTDGRAILTLYGDIEAPVSRTYYPRLREAGWF